MKARWKGSESQNAAMKKEIRRQILEQEDEYFKGIDTMVLWALHSEFDFGKQRLERAYKAIIREYKQMKNFYAMDDTYPAEYKLKEIGIDMEKLRKEVES